VRTRAVRAGAESTGRERKRKEIRKKISQKKRKKREEGGEEQSRRLLGGRASFPHLSTFLAEAGSKMVFIERRKEEKRNYEEEKKEEGKKERCLHVGAFFFSYPSYTESLRIV